MKQKLMIVCGLIVSLALLTGCHAHYSHISSYLDGAVVVMYQNEGGHNDFLDFRFYEPGVYAVSFSIVPGDDGHRSLPVNFTKIIETAPREIIVEQWKLPDYLRVTISKDDRTESHDFN